MTFHEIAKSANNLSGAQIKSLMSQIQVVDESKSEAELEVFKKAHSSIKFAEP